MRVLDLYGLDRTLAGARTGKSGGPYESDNLDDEITRLFSDLRVELGRDDYRPSDDVVNLAHAIAAWDECDECGENLSDCECDDDASTS